jgi:hypothetical protein
MTIEVLNLIISSIILFFFVGFDVLLMRVLRGTFARISTRYAKKVDSVDDYDEEYLSDGELARLERERDFDQRISRMKNEIADKHATPRKGTVAESLHPDVINLPHNIIPNHTNDDLPDVEITR